MTNVLEFHPIAELFPLITGDDFTALVEDIRANGLREPIWTHDGKIIDGRNRYRACLEAGTEPSFRVWDGNGSLTAFVVSLNLQRRHLTPSQRAMVAVEMLPWLEREAKARQGARTDLVHFPQLIAGSEARQQAAEVAHTNRQYVSDAKKLAATAPVVAEQVRVGKVTIPQAKRLVQQSEQVQERVLEQIEAVTPTGEAVNVPALIKAAQRDIKQEIEANAQPTPVDDMGIHCADLANAHIAPGTVDVMLTDPPYLREYIPTYGLLAQRAAEWLKPGGSLIVLCGQSYLPELLAQMTPHLRYHWTLAYLTPGGQSAQLWERNVNTFWKPVLWLVKGEYAGEWIGDVAKSDVNDNDKRFHGWGQSESGIADLMRRFTKPGDLVCDPMVGGGTTAVVAMGMGRRFIGFDRDEAAVETTRRRLAAEAEAAQRENAG